MRKIKSQEKKMKEVSLCGKMACTIHFLGGENHYGPGSYYKNNVALRKFLSTIVGADKNLSSISMQVSSPLVISVT